MIDGVVTPEPRTLIFTSMALPIICQSQKSAEIAPECETGTLIVEIIEPSKVVLDICSTDAAPAGFADGAL